MYKSETKRSLERALLNVLAHQNAAAALRVDSDVDMTEKVDQLANMLAEQIWADGYEIGPRSSALPQALRF